MDLTAQKREKLGRVTKTLRDEGLIPAELYGRGLANQHLSVSAKEFKKVFKEAGESTVIQLVVESKKHPVMIHDVARDPIDEEILNIDFYQVRMDEKLKLKVPLVFEGEAAAVKEKQGVLVKAVSEIEIEALPADLPHDLKVDLTLLKDIGNSISVKDLITPKGVEVKVDLATVVATVTARMTEEEEAKLAAEADVSAIKSEVEEKKEARDAEKAAAVPAEGETAAPAAAKPEAKK